MKRTLVRLSWLMCTPSMLLLVLFTVPSPTHCAWTSGGPAGGHVTCMIRSPSHPATIYAGTTSGIWKSIDSGETWARTGFPDAEVLSIQVVPDNQDIVYAGTTHAYATGGILKSVNGGLSWSPMGIAGQDVNAIAIDPNHTTTLYAGTGSFQNSWPEEVVGIYKSPNGGDDWTLTISFGGTGEPMMREITAIVVDPDDSATVYAGGRNYGVPVFAALLKSTDYGDTWTDKAFKGNWSHIGALSITPKGYQPKTLFVTIGEDPSPSDFDYFSISTDGGTTWNTWSAPFTPALAVNPLNADFVYVGSGATMAPTFPMWIFNHRQQLWTPFFSDGLPVTVTSPTSIVMNPGEDTYFCAGFFSSGIYKVRSSGNWYQTPLHATNILDVAPQPGSSNTVVAAVAGYHHLSISTDGGSSWGDLVNAPTNSAAVTYDPQNPQHIFAGFGWDSRSNHAYQLDLSTDGGLNWTHSGLLFAYWGTVFLGTTDIWINPDDDQKMIVTVGSLDGGLFVSSNGGASWGNLPKDFWASTVAADPNDSERLYYGTFHRGYVYRSVNGGEYWMDISPVADIFWEVRDIAVGLNATVFAATDVGLWAFDGSIWTKKSGLPSDDMTALTFDRSASPEILYAGTGDCGVFSTTDGGMSWNSFNDGLDVHHITKLAISDTVPKVLYAGTAYGGVWQYDFTAEACGGDFDTDGDVDGSDLAVFAADFGDEGDVDGSDLALFAADFGRTDCPE